MTSKRQRTLKLKITPQLRSLLPKATQRLKGTQFNQAVSGILRDVMNPLGGLISAMSVSGDAIRIEWEPSPADPTPLEVIVGLLKKGQYVESVWLLELLLSDEPEQVDYLYNLGMVYSDLSDLTRAISLLKRTLELDPQHTNGRIALGVALTRDNQIEQALQELQTAVAQAPTNSWAQRNLGAALAKQQRFAEAIPYLQRAAELNPEDQAAWFGLGQALEFNANVDGADEAYRKVLEIDEFSQIADLTRTARSRIAQGSFRSAAPAVERMDAVMYCLGALEKFESMSTANVQKIGFEIAILGTHGLDINNPNAHYTLRSLPGDYSGLHLLCLQYVAFQKFAPGQDIGFDLATEYVAALALYEQKHEQ